MARSRSEALHALYLRYAAILSPTVFRHFWCDWDPEPLTEFDPIFLGM